MRRYSGDPTRVIVCCQINKSKVLLLIGRTKDALNAVQEALVITTLCEDRRSTADCLLQLNFVYYSTARFEDVAHCSYRCLSLCQKIGYTAGIADCYEYIALTLDNEGNIKSAIEYYAKSAERWQEAGDLEEYAKCLQNMGIDFELLGDYQTAETYYRQAQDVAIRIGSLSRQFKSEQLFASLQSHRGDYQGALISFQKVLKAYERIGDRYNEAITLQYIGNIHHALGDHAEAFRCLNDSERFMEEIADLWSQVWGLNMLTRFSTDCGEFDQAARYLGKGDGIASTVGDIYLFSRLAVARAELALARGDNEEATSAMNRALVLADQTDLKAGKADATLIRARINMTCGHHEEAEPLFRKALGLFQEQQSVLDQGIVQYYHGLNKKENSQEAEARALLTNAREIFRRIGAATWLARAEQALAGIPA